MPSITLATQTVATQTGTAVPTIPTTVLTNSLTALDTSASRGPASNADNTALPLFGCRAFVNFDGTSYQNVTVNGATEAHCVIRSSGNVSKVVRNATATYTITFTIAMPDANYAIVGSTIGSLHASYATFPSGANLANDVAFAKINIRHTNGSVFDHDNISIMVFR